MEKSRLAVGLLVVQLVGCGGGDDGPAPAHGQGLNVVPAPGEQSARLGPYLFGSVEIGEDVYFSEMFIGGDGTLRLHVQDRNGSGKSAQLVGRVQRSAGALQGTGIVIGLRCAHELTNRLCEEAATAEISGEITTIGETHGLAGEIRVHGDEGEEVWRFSHMQHSLFLNRLAAGELQADYVELAAEFAGEGDTIVSVDAAGRIFFQSAGSGCVGNGKLSELAVATFNLFEATIRVESCNPSYAHLNGEFMGLAGPVADGWDYGHYLLLMMLSSTDPAAPPVAIAMSGRTEM